MRATGAVIASVLLLAAAGCDWRQFDKLKEKTPVAAIAAPSGYSASDDFGPVLLALAPPTDNSSAGRFIATATLKTSLAVVSYDPSGRPTGFSPSNDGLNGLQGGPITAIGAIPGGRQVLLGAPTAFLGDVLVMSLDPPYNAAPFIGTSNDPRYGTGVAAGNLSGGADPEVVVASGNKIHVYVDSLPTMDKPYLSTGPTDPCPIDIPNNLPEDDLLNRAVIVGPLLGSGMQIAVGAPVTSGNGHVSIFNFDAAATAPTCAATLTGSEAHFGRSMTLVDLDPANGIEPDHLLVGAPQTHAYLYKLPLATGAAPVAMVTDTDTDGNFGFSVAAFDLDGKPGDEMFVGAPDGSVGGANAGRVSVYTGATMTLLPSTPTFPNPLAQHDPGAGDGYGMAIAGVTFCPGNVDGGAAPCTKLLHVGSRSKVYAYYTLRTPDPRVK